MKWVLVIVAIVNGKPYHADPVTFHTKEACLEVLKIVEQHPMFKQYSAKAACEHG